MSSTARSTRRRGRALAALAAPPRRWRRPVRSPHRPPCPVATRRPSSAARSLSPWWAVINAVAASSGSPAEFLDGTRAGPLVPFIAAVIGVAATVCPSCSTTATNA